MAVLTSSFVGADSSGAAHIRKGTTGTPLVVDLSIDGAAVAFANLTDPKIRLRRADGTDVEVVEFALVDATATGTAKLALGAVEWAKLKPGRHLVEVDATLAAGRMIWPTRGAMALEVHPGIADMDILGPDEPSRFEVVAGDSLSLVLQAQDDNGAVDLTGYEVDVSLRTGDCPERTLAGTVEVMDQVQSLGSVEVKLSATDTQGVAPGVFFGRVGYRNGDDAFSSSLFEVEIPTR